LKGVLIQKTWSFWTERLHHLLGFQAQ
jgi:hypothetical protein